jgi:Arabinose efflux permease
MTITSIKIDDLPMRRFHYKVACLTFGAHFTDGYILGLIGIAFTQITPSLNLNAFWQGAIGSSALLGLFLGSLFFGWISDLLGRQKIFLVSFILIAIASLCQIFVQNALQLFILRVLIGIGLGGDFSVGHAILAEFAPRKHRGVLLGSFSAIWTIGYVAATFVGVGLLPLGEDIWRLVLATSFIPAVIILLARVGTPESPRWLLHKGRKKEAYDIVHKYLGTNVIIDEEEVDIHNSGFKALFRKKYIKRTIFNCLFFVCIVMPYFAIYTFLPLILDTIGFSGGFGVEMLLNAMLIIGALFGIWCTIKFSRRGFLITSFFVLAGALFSLVLLPASLAIIQIVAFAIFTMVLSAVSNLVGVYPAESFPTEVRASGVGFSIAISRFGSVVSTFLLPISVMHLGIMPTITILGLVLLFGGVISYFLAPETKDLSLAEAAQVKTR